MFCFAAGLEKKKAKASECWLHLWACSRWNDTVLNCSPTSPLSPPQSVNTKTRFTTGAQTISTTCRAARAHFQHPFSHWYFISLYFILHKCFKLDTRLIVSYFIVCASIRQWVLFGSSNKDHQVKKVVCVSVNETNLYSISEMCLIHVENKWEIQPILFNYIIYFYILSLTKIWVFCVFLNWS